MPHDHLTQHADLMLGYLRKQFPNSGDDDQRDAVQTVFMEVIARGSDFAPDEATWKTYLCQSAFYAMSKICKQRERAWFQSLSSDHDPDVKDAIVAGPDVIVDEVDRRDRQQLLLSDILQEYVLRCELQSMHTQREIYERRLRGQDVKSIASSMGIARDSIDQHLKRARDWINDRMQQADVERSVFQTLLRPKRDVPILSDSVPADVPRNFHEVLMRVVNDVGALCPSKERLAKFERHSQSVEFSDLRYHIQNVPCLLCQARQTPD